ncbi:DgyrCDS10761 [Dimorphilus gyrociliatus]|uniref:DgyrCDS10761 n=1 Tax=Dimorphilus gyrociliatus TaxID=2664684 RepID=A0A7I8W2C7_9ANNE|nr:DgyrCDS10761 [Dimorphilus gyrociliatus]
MVGLYFNKRRALATGIAMCGSGIGGFIFSPLSEFLIELYGWKGTSLIMSGILLNGVIFGGMLRPLKIQVETYENDEKNSEIETFIKPSNGNQKDKGIFNSVQCLKKPKMKESENTYKSMDDIQSIKPSFKSFSGSIEKLVSREQKEKLNDELDNEKDTPEKEGSNRFKFFIRNHIDFSLLLDPAFELYGLCCFLCMIGFFIPFTCSVDDAITKGITKSDASLLISVIGISNVVSRITSGWLSDQIWVDCLTINVIALIIGGVATMLIPISHSFWSLSICSALFGMGIAVFVSSRSVIMVELLGLDKLTSAFGFVTMFQGISSFFGAPIAGSLFDSNGNYTASFILAGATLVSAGIFCIPLRKLSELSKKKIKVTSEYDIGIPPSKTEPYMSC